MTRFPRTNLFLYPFKRDPDTMAPCGALPEHLTWNTVWAVLKRTTKLFRLTLVHQQMVEERAQKVALLAQVIPQQNHWRTGRGYTDGFWGGTYGHMLSAESQLRAEGTRWDWLISITSIRPPTRKMYSGALRRSWFSNLTAVILSTTSGQKCLSSVTCNTTRYRDNPYSNRDNGSNQ